MPTAFLPLQRNITHFTSNDISFIDNIRSSNNIAYGAKAKVTKKAEPQARDSAFILFLLKYYLAGTNVILCDMQDSDKLACQLHPSSCHRVVPVELDGDSSLREYHA